MRALVLALAILFGAQTSQAAHAAEENGGTLLYVVSPVFEHDGLAGLSIRFDLEADADGVTQLHLPDRSMGKSGLWRRLGDITVEGATDVQGDGPAVRIVRSRPHTLLTVRYTLRSGLARDPTESDGYPTEPWIRPSWFYVDGASAFVTVEGREAASVVLRWRDWPKDFHLASNLEQGGRRKPQLGVLIGGRDVQVTRSGDLRLAVRGAFGFSDAVLARELETILGQERTFWGESGGPYLVAAARLEEDAGGYFTGVGKGDAFAMVATPSMTLNDMRVFLAHEIFHTWNPLRLGRSAGEANYWFSEGFTDFYARRLLHRGRLISSQAFLDLWNDMLRAHDLSPARGMSGAQAAKAFWTDPDAERLAYQRGALLAAIWDQRLRAKGFSLDVVLRRQAVAAKGRPGAALVGLFLEEMKAQGVDVEADIQRFIEAGAPLELPPDVFAPCADLVEKRTPTFDLGFIPKMNEQGLMVVEALRPGSAAYRAGLREGMVVVRKRAGTNGVADRPYELEVRSAEGATGVFSFLPAGSGTVVYRQFVLRAGATLAACDLAA
ncbi:putative metalloprotease with PDZ domain [Caulobacter sp. BE264]|uniref:M61 family metallopeptidase n=1 Tax=Caulobacter sp. BE264 TaxID=2817724 RepID=UPI0028601245|nr:hypothetical protein [Caulobacter sp. BE264]MDR7232849.1 putative metalloprotease with PDZ domain [Caulobacter sp. BE264]